MQGIRINDNFLYWCAALLLLLGYLLHLGLQPLYLEEPRRAIVAMELLENQNLWVPTLIGEFYYNKPPLYNWVLIVFARLLGGFDAFNLRLPTVLATFTIAGLMYGAARRYWQDEQLARLAALLFLTSAGILLYFSMLAEIDLFYALLVFMSFLAIYHFGQKKQYWLLFLSVYSCCALGVLTKGLPSFIFTAVSLLVYFIDQRRFRYLFYPAHLLGIAWLGLLLFGYYYQYAQYHDVEQVWLRMLSESSDRTAVSNSFVDFVTHLIVFPLNWLGDMAPASLLLLFLWRKDWKALLLQSDPFLRFCVLLLCFNALPYWISPGTRMRYVYMLYPLASLILAWVYQHRSKANPRSASFFTAFARILMGAVALVVWALPFVPELAFMRQICWVLAAGMSISVGACLYFSYTKSTLTLPTLILVFALIRLVFDLTVLPQRNDESGGQRDRQLAVQIDQIVGDAPLFTAFEPKVVAYTTIVYLNQLRPRVVRRKDVLKKGAYYLLPLHRAPKNVQILLTTEYGGQIKALIKQ